MRDRVESMKEAGSGAGDAKDRRAAPWRPIVSTKVAAAGFQRQSYGAASGDGR